MKHLILVLTSVALLASCSLLKKQNKKEILFTNNGSPYTVDIESPDSTKEAIVGDEVHLRYQLIYQDSVVYSRNAENNPEVFKLGFGKASDGLEDAVKSLEKGETGRFMMDFSVLKSRAFKGLNDTDKVKLVLTVDSIILHPELNPFSTFGKDTVTTPSGLKYVIIEKGTGEKVATGDKVKVHYTGFLPNGNIFDSSVERGQPFESPIGKGRLIKGWDEGFTYFNVGDKVKLIVPADLGYGARDRGRIPANSTLVFDIQILSTKKPAIIVPFDVSGKDVNQTGSGLQYVMVENGTGVKASPGKKVFVHYTGYLTNGKRFDSSVERDEPFTFNLGMGRVIKGWDEGVALMHVGDKIRFTIPANLAYGERGAPPTIPSGATLIFDVELLKVH